MKKSILSLIAMGASASVAYAGTESYSGKEMKQVTPASTFEMPNKKYFFV
jgi:hypothetical protein